MCCKAELFCYVDRNGAYDTRYVIIARRYDRNGTDCPSIKFLCYGHICTLLVQLTAMFDILAVVVLLRDRLYSMHAARIAMLIVHTHMQR